MKKMQSNKKIGIVLMLVCAACLRIGQFIWKLYNGLFPIAIGFGIYGFGALAMLYAYRFGNLSSLQPLNSIGYVIAAILGSFFLGETITVVKIVAIVTIMLGVFFLTGGELAE